MFVCANRLIAYAFYLNLMELRPEWKEKRKVPEGMELSEKEEKELKANRESASCHDKK